ncbi:MAG: UDP-N-acetylmuramoyl-L-alanyl-D-glutamate--2,6-diaminopimelate ligase [Actinobacteria bacterium]|nr:UDP-N-acetylmuramoyl-L-alanyl-D-glutamate--2,6-diaminopimelate ligase [Actinomycetota bacterium]
MMKLNQILKAVKPLEIIGSTDKEISSISYDSRKINKDSLFVAVPGFKKDGHEYIYDAVRNGAYAVVSQRKIQLADSITQIIVPDCRAALARISSNFYLNPSSNLALTGITGTNGKTTTVFLIDKVLRNTGRKTSLITTIESFIIDKKISFDRTTPESLELNNFFSESIKAGAYFSTMEVSSHAVDLHRIDNLDFDYFVFTNLTQDHLDYHTDMENYFNTKKKLFVKEFRNLFGGKGAVINADDSYGRKLMEITDLEVMSFSVHYKNSDVKASNILSNASGIEMDVAIKGHEKIKIKSKLSGYFNVYNILASIGACIFLGMDIDLIQEGINMMGGVNGRFEKITEVSDFNVIVDYAHTPDGLENVVKTAKSLLIPGSKLITVFGCGGDRDKTKRKIMGNIAGSLSDYVFITSDNPRTEDPLSIMDMIEEGLTDSGSKSYKKIADRKQAIIEALNMAQKNDIVVIAGKGHEDYQEFNGYRIYFSDQKIVRDWAAGVK